MRIALTGAHATGRSAPAAELARPLLDHRVMEEPYHRLDAEGHAFATAPTLEDFEAAQVLVGLAMLPRASDDREAR